MNDKILKIETGGIQNDQHDTYFNHRYEPTDYENLDKLFDELSLTQSDCFVDFGCGKGRLNFYVHHRFQCASVGVELNETYYQIAEKNKKSYVGHAKERIQFVNVPAQNYHFIGKENYLYFFHPFSVEIFGKVIQNIYDSLCEQPRTCYLILYYPDSEYLYYIEQYTGLRLRKQIDVAGSEKDNRECFCIYEF